MARLAFIMAASHSGSTLLAMLLGSHPEAITIGDTAGTENRKVPDYRCSCGQRSRECLFWQRVKSEMTARGFDLEVGDFGTRFDCQDSRLLHRVLRAEHRGRFLEAVRDGILAVSPTWRRRSKEVAARNLALIEAVTEVTGAKILVDSSKLPHRLKFLLRIPDLEVKVVHLIRDGRGVSHTCVNDNKWSVEESAFQWQRGIQAAEKLLAGLSPEMWTQVRYEDICADPRAELEKLSTFLGMDPSRVNLDFRSAGLHIFGNKMRLSTEANVLLDDRWRTDFSSSEIETIEQIAGFQLNKYGYAVGILQDI